MLHLASQNGDENMIRTLYLARANATLTDNEGERIKQEFPTNIASVNLVIGCSKFFFNYSNTCPGVLTLYEK